MYNGELYENFKNRIKDYTSNINKQYDGIIHSTLLSTVYDSYPFTFSGMENPFIDIEHNIYKMDVYGGNGELFFTITDGVSTYNAKIFNMDNLAQSNAFTNEIFNNMYFNRNSEAIQYVGRFLPTMKYAKVFKSNDYIKANHIPNINNVGMIAYTQFRQLFNNKDGII